jgi:hypothetical protein
VRGHRPPPSPKIAAGALPAGLLQPNAPLSCGCHPARSELERLGTRRHGRPNSNPPRSLAINRKSAACLGFSPASRRGSNPAGVARPSDRSVERCCRPSPLPPAGSAGSDTRSRRTGRRRADLHSTGRVRGVGTDLASETQARKVCACRAGARDCFALSPKTEAPRSGSRLACSLLIQNQ